MTDSIFSTFEQAQKRWPDRSFLYAPAEAVGGDAPFQLTYAQAAGIISELTARYRSAGYTSGHRIAFVLDSHPLALLHLIAINACGSSVVPLNAGSQPKEMAHILSAAACASAVAWPQYHERIRDAAVLAGLTLAIIAPDEAPPAVGAVAPFERDEAVLMFTSGTTGAPKGCILSNEYFVEIGRWYAEVGGYCAFDPDGDRLLTPLPLTHMNALALSFMAVMETGSCLIQLDRFHASTWWQTVRECQATIIHYLGVMPAILLQKPVQPDERDGLRVRFGFGAGIDPRHHQIFEDRFGFPLIEAWAMTETGAGATIIANVEPRHVGTRCFGRPDPALVEFRIVDHEERDVAKGESGELLVRHAGTNPHRGFFSGYDKDPEATAEVWRDGWFHTGDIVQEDDGGSLHFVDRSKNIVRRSGENIAAVEVEGVLLAHPAVAGCAVLPVEDEIRGEEVMALVVVKAGETADDTMAETLRKHSLDSLVYFKVPGYFAFVDALPTTASQKVQRGQVRALGRSLVDSGVAVDLRHLKKSKPAAK